MQHRSIKTASSATSHFSVQCPVGSLSLIVNRNLLISGFCLTLPVAIAVIMWWYWNVIVSCFLIGPPIEAYEITDRPFSQLIQTIPIAPHFENLTLHHDLYEGIGNGSLQVETFKAFLQQDRLYVQNLFKLFEIVSSRENDSERIKYLERLVQDRGVWDDLFAELFSDFSVPPANQMTPATLDFAGKPYILAKYDDLGVALASLTTCFTLWHKIGLYWKSLNPEIQGSNPYKKFVQKVAEQEATPPEFLTFVDGYYARLNGSKPKELAVKQRMLDAYTESMELEYRFACEMLKARPINASTVFTDTTPLILPEIQNQVINHPLYTEIALGTLPLETYKVLIQQDYLYMRGFYKAYEYMERKEADFNLKTPLRKDGQDFYNFFESEFKHFNFGPASATAPYALEYLEHDIRIGRDRPVGEGVANTYPCYFLWFEFGAKVNEIAAKMPFSNHPYQTFLDSVKPSYNEDSVEKAKKTLNQYYNSTSVEGKYRILQVIRQSIFHELEFANGVYGQRYHF